MADGHPDDICQCGCPRRDHLFWFLHCEMGTCPSRCRRFSVAALAGSAEDGTYANRKPSEAPERAEEATE